MKKLFTNVAAFMLLVAVGGSTSAQTILMSEDFEGGALPSGWAQITSATDGGWNFGTNTALQSQYFPIDPHTLFACTNDDACDCDKSNDNLYTMSVDLSSSTTAFLSFDSYYFNASYSGSTETAKIVASTDGGVTWTDVATIPGASGWHTEYANLTSLVGNSDVKVGFKYNDDGAWMYGWCIDNVVILEPAVGLDLSVSNIVTGKNDPTPAFISLTKYIVGLPLQVEITVLNQATVPVTSFDVSWTDGTNTFNQNITGVNIGIYETYSFFAVDPYNTLNGNTSITVTLSNVNGGATEVNTTNNVSTHDVLGIMVNPDRKYFVEEGTGTWCGWCPRGAVFMNYMTQSYPNEFVGVAVHNGDVMTVAAYDGGLGISAFPGVKVYRNTTIDPSALEADFLNIISTPVDVTITGSATLNTSINQLTVNADATFINSLSGNYTFAAILVEDSVHGTATTYGQHNYYANNAAGPMGGFESLPAIVPASLMYYNHVGRALIGGFTGVVGSIPANPQASNTYSYSFAPMTPTATWNQNHMHVVIVVRNGANGRILNAVTVPIVFTTNIPENSSVSSLNIYPSPANDFLNFDLNLKSAEKINVTVTDMMGKAVLSQNLGTLTGQQTLRSDVSQLAAGVYNIRIQTGSETIQRKFVKE